MNMYTGVGYSLNAKLSSLGVSTCSDLQKLPLSLLQKQFGTKSGQMLYNRSRGIDERTFRTGVERKSVSAEMNYGIRFTTVCCLLSCFLLAVRKISSELSHRFVNCEIKSFD